MPSLENDIRYVMCKRNLEAVPMDGADCKQWKATHENCSGCPDEIACRRMVALMFDAYTENITGKVNSERTVAILDATTLDELDKLVDQAVDEANEAMLYSRLNAIPDEEMYDEMHFECLYRDQKGD